MSPRNQDSDPLPYTQVDRSVKAKAALLASFIKTTNQHALGSLVNFWELCGDPRELEELIDRSVKEGAEPEVILDAEDVALRFELASGHRVEPTVLERLSFVEPRGDGRYRVRGMSRFFSPLLERRRRRDAAVAAGKASAESRRASSGTAQPRKPRSTPAQRAPERPPNDARTSVEPEPLNDARTPPERPPKTADSVQRSISRDPSYEGSPEPRRKRKRQMLIVDVPPTPPRAPAPSDVLVAEFAAAGLGAYLWQGAKDGTALSDLLQTATLDEIVTRWRRGLAAPVKAWASCRTVAQLRQKWNDLAATEPPAAPQLDEVTAEAVERVLKGYPDHLGPYVAGQISQNLRWRRAGDELIGESEDEYFVAWCREHYPTLSELGMRVAHVGGGAAA